MTNYIAPKPKKSLSATVLGGLTYPLTLLRYPLGWVIGLAVLPATILDFSQKKRPEAKQFKGSFISFSYPDIKTYDDVRLQTMEMVHAEQLKKPAAEQKYVIFFNGNGMDFTDNREEATRYMREGKFNTILFNYRGTGGVGRKPLSSADLTIDGIAQVQRLLDMGVPSENIILRGLSLGGGVATKVAEYFHLQEKKPIYIFNDRSFSSLQNVVIGHIRQLFNKKPIQEDTMIGKLLGFILYPIVWGFLQLSSWEIPASKAFKHIPPEYRDYALVRTPKGNRINQQDDFIITHYGSLHEGLADERAAAKVKLKRLKREAPEQKNDIRALEYQLKHHKYEDVTFSQAFSHMESPVYLKNRSGSTLHQEFTLFAKKAFKSDERSSQQSAENKQR